MKFYNRNIFLNCVFYGFVAILLISRALIFFNVNLDYIDSDMPFMWAGIKDYSQGLFYEPRFYGQDYNTFMESLLAVPLYWLNVPVYYALPIAAHFVSLFPYLFTAFYLFYLGKKENAIMVLALLLCMTPGYHIMTSLPRGISGVFFTSFFILSILNPNNFRYLILNTLLSVLGYFVTPNSVIVSVPFLAFLFFNNYKNKNYYFVTFCCLLSVIPFYFIFDKFYIDHPEYIIYGLKNHWSLGNFIDAVSHPGRSFVHISLVIEENPLLLLFVFFTLAIALFKKNKIAFYSFLSFTGIILISFFASKVGEGLNWPFYSYSRMYIGIPMAIALFTVFFQIRSRIFITLIIILTLTYSLFKFINFKTSVTYHTDEKRWVYIHLVSLNTVLEGAEAFKNHCIRNNVDYILISNTFWLCTYLNYGGQTIFKEFPNSQETNSERRYWVREGNKDKVFKRFMLLSVNYDFDKQCANTTDFKVKRLDDYGLFLIEENTLKDKDFASLVRECERD